jgi:hypothetical protein
MSNEIEKAYINKFRAGFADAFQQSTSRFRPYVEIERQAAEFEFYDRIGLATKMQQVTSRYGKNPINDVPHERRRVALKDWDWGMPVDEKDLIRVLTDPSGSYTQAALKEANRQVDEIVVAGAFAPAYTGKNGENVVTFVPSVSGKINVGAVSNVNSHIATAGFWNLATGSVEGVDVAVDFVTTGSPASSGLTLDKLKSYRTTLLKLEAIEQDAVIDLFLPAEGFQQLLTIDEVINSDYATRKSLAEGNVTTFMGYRFIHSEKLPRSGGVTQCIALAGRPAIKLAIAKDIDAQVWRLTERKNIPYIYVKMTMEAVRFWGEITGRINIAI